MRSLAIDDWPSGPEESSPPYPTAYSSSSANFPISLVRHMTGLREVILMRVYTSRHSTADSEEERDQLWRAWLEGSLIEACGKEKGREVKIELLRKSVLWDRGRDKQHLGDESEEDLVVRWDEDSIPHWMAHARKEAMRKRLEREDKYR